MIFSVHILQSDATGSCYCGYSTDVQRRLSQHNDSDYQLSKTTKRTKGPRKLIWTQEMTNRSEAMILEKRIKKRGIRRFLTRSVGRVPPWRD